MTTTILRATVGAGKTEAVLQRLSEVVHQPQKPFAKVWILLASSRQQIAFRERLAYLPDAHQVYFNTEIFDFPSLYSHLLKRTHQPQLRINDAARVGILRRILSQLYEADALQVFAPIAEKMGFATLVAQFIQELKQNLIEPSTFAQYAEHLKDEDILKIYSAYQQLLIDNQFVDQEGEAWLTLDALRHDINLASDVDLVIVDGFDQFSSVQAQILAALSAHVDEMLITLTAIHGSDAKQMGGRFQQAMQRLRTAHDEADVPLDDDDIPQQSNRHPDLQHLNQAIFDMSAQQQRLTSDDAVRLFEAPEPPQEVAMVLRDVKRQLVAGVQPEEILIAIRDWTLYQKHFAVLGRLYDLPLAMHYDQPVAENPAINILMKVLSLSGGRYASDRPDRGFHRRDVLDILRSPYVNVVGLDDEAVQFLDEVSQTYQIVRGYDAWFEALEQVAGHTFESDQDEDDEKRRPQWDIAPEKLNDVMTALEDFFEAVTPPQQGTLTDYIVHIERLIGTEPQDNPEDDLADSDPFASMPEDMLEYPQQTYVSLNMPACIQTLHDQPHLIHLATQDMMALNAFKDILRGYLANQVLLQLVWQDQPLNSWDYLYADLQESLQVWRSVQDGANRSGRILVTTATNARGLPHDYVYIVGMSEGIFPALRKEDPLYLDSEREALRQRSNGIIYLPTQAEQSDDAGLFYELLSLARKSLTLSRPTVQSGKPWNESHLWRSTRDTFHEGALRVHRMGIGELPPPSLVTSVDEAFLVVAQALSESINTWHDDTLVLAQWLLAQSEYAARWQAIVHASKVEQKRLSPQAYDTYTGILQSPALVDAIQAEINAWYPWSASRLNEMGICRYKFFASRLLHLSATSEPEEGFDQLQFGSMMHKILEDIYAQVRLDDLAVHPDNQNDALEIAEEVLEKVIKHAPAWFGVRVTPQWQYEQAYIRKIIRQNVAWDFSEEAPLYRANEPRYVYATEQRFKTPITIEGWHESLRLNGSIDRVDRIDDQLYVMDYKTGSAPEKADMQAGRNFQMFVYLRALESLVAGQGGTRPRVQAGFFWQLRDASASKMLQNIAEDKANFMDAEEIFASSEQHIAQHIAQLQVGNFAVEPSTIAKNGRCSTYCDFYQLCRLTNVNRYKPQSASRDADIQET
jgi:ATP-dependent helicase/DNAse subunit B